MSLIRAEKGWDFVVLGGYYRRYTKVYLPTAFGLVMSTEDLLDPFLGLFPYEAQLRQVLDQQLARWAPSE
ncbi:hypothetical protein [Sorangium sp. So ce1078]|uniref:hypothetical protein n=1 Tax=Sorangium sp. So ce1078 TaxID=3133329 RepID=UPI003F63E9B2